MSRFTLLVVALLAGACSAADETESDAVPAVAAREEPSSARPRAERAPPAATVAQEEVPYAIGGVVVDAGGAPIADVEVRLDSDQPAVARTDADGAFRVEPVPAWTFRAVLSKPGFVTRDDTDVECGRVDARFVLEREKPEDRPPETPRYCVVRIEDAAGRPAADVRPYRRVGHDDRRETRDDGALVLRGRFPDEVEDLVFDAGLEWGLHVFVPTSSSRDAPATVVRLPAWKRLEVVVREPDGHDPDIDYRVELQGGPERVRERTDERNRRTFSIDPGCRYIASAQAGGLMTIVRAVTADEIDAGHVVLTPTGGAQVRFVRPGTSVGCRAELLAGDPPGEYGSFAWDGSAEHCDRVPAGPATLVLRRQRGGEGPSLTVVRLPIVVPAEGVLDLGVVTPPRIVALTGRVVTPDGVPAGGARITVIDEEDSTTDGGTSSARPDGSFSVQAPEGRNLCVLATRSGAGAAVVRLQAPRGPVELRLGRECRIRTVELLPMQERGISFAYVGPVGSRAQWSPDCESGRTSLGGTGTPGDVAMRIVERVWRGLSPGPIAVHVWRRGAEEIREIVLTPDAETTLDLDAPPR